MHHLSFQKTRLSTDFLLISTLSVLIFSDHVVLSLQAAGQNYLEGLRDMTINDNMWIDLLFMHFVIFPFLLSPEWLKAGMFERPGCCAEFWVEESLLLFGSPVLPSS